MIGGRRNPPTSREQLFNYGPPAPPGIPAFSLQGAAGMSKNREHEYDVALSFAGEDRAYVEAVAGELERTGVRVFYDASEEAVLWGKDLYTHLDEIYRNRARYCVMFISENYARKLWTNHERESAQARAFQQHEEYILPARFDGTEIPGVRPTTGYIDLQGRTPADLARLVLQKLGRPAAGQGSASPAAPGFRTPRTPRRGFNPYEEAERLIQHLTAGIQGRAEALADRGVSFTKFSRSGRTCLRVLSGGKTRYSLDVWMGGLTRDASIAFSYQRGEAHFQSNSMNAWGTVHWSKERDVPVLPFVGFMGSGHQEQEYTYNELVDVFWNEICDALEEERW